MEIVVELLSAYFCVTLKIGEITSILNVKPAIGFVECIRSGNFLVKYMFIGNDTVVVVYRLVPGEPEILIGEQGNCKVESDED
jgi:hypothetical protein